MKTIYPVSCAQETDYDEITALWEASVRATHTFLTEKDILFYREEVRNRYLKNLSLFCIRNDRNRIVAFSGINRDKIEMLFVLPGECGKGWGKQLVTHAIQVQGASLVDVNEQNEKAFAFYRHLGFIPYKRDARDDQGNPFPILRLKLHNENRPPH